ncbi:MAG: formylglycine-generating enzyme family protein [Chthoniobacterales bacterium]
MCALGWLLIAMGLASAARAGSGHHMIVMPSGEYIVGGKGHAANPQRTVRLAAFEISDAETTNAQFARFVKAAGYVTDAEKSGFGMVSREGMIDWEWEKVRGACWRLPQGPKGPRAAEITDHPVTQISGADAEAYCRWAGGRLPGIEEWEVAARGGSRARFPWGKTFEAKKANIWNGDSHLRNTMADGFLFTAPVRSYLPNKSGLYDVIGNVFEYCSGFPNGVSKESRPGLIAARGGSWWCSQGTCGFFNLVDIGVMDRHGSLSNQGFRLAMTAR